MAKTTKMESSAWGYNWVTLFLGDINMGTCVPQVGGISNLRKQNVIMSHAGLGPENDYAAEGQQQL
jgi:hypothetical protein